MELGTPHAAKARYYNIPFRYPNICVFRIINMFESVPFKQHISEDTDIGNRRYSNIPCVEWYNSWSPNKEINWLLPKINLGGCGKFPLKSS